MQYKDFTEFLYDKFDKEDTYNSFLAHDSPEKFDEWVVEVDVDSLIKWADEFAQHQVAKALEGVTHGGG